MAYLTEQEKKKCQRTGVHDIKMVSVNAVGLRGYLRSVSVCDILGKALANV